MKKSLRSRPTRRRVGVLAVGLALVAGPAVLAGAVTGPALAEADAAAVVMENERIVMAQGNTRNVNVMANDTLPGSPKRLRIVRAPEGIAATVDGTALRVTPAVAQSFAIRYEVTTPRASGRATLYVVARPPASPDPGPGFTLNRRDDFDGNALDETQWAVFDGRGCGCSDGSLWDDSQTVVSGGTLKLHNRLVDGRWLSGGVGGWRGDMAGTYGAFQARIRFEKADTAGHWAAALAWPANNNWPEDGELDFYEVFESSPQRDRMRQTLHYASTDGAHQQNNGPSLSGDFSAWQVAGVEWTPERVTFTLNGADVLTVTDPAQIPRTKMWMGFQNVTKLIGGRAPAPESDGGPVTFEVDWAEYYRYTPDA